jgi:hypothetical protein
MKSPAIPSYASHSATQWSSGDSQRLGQPTLAQRLLATNVYEHMEEASMTTTIPPRIGYAPVNGLNMYYEIHGEGQPLLLLHGAFSAIGTSFGKLLPGLVEGRQVNRRRVAGPRPHSGH